MTRGDRGAARLTKLLADRERAERVGRIRRQMREDDRAYAMGLAVIRHAAGLTQGELARRLGVGQAAVSTMERQHDLLLSTLASYVAAAGANARIVVAFGNRDLEFDLTALTGPPPDAPQPDPKYVWDGLERHND
ncbi:transcriptional regulator [Mycolicibacter kumamotonensis]|uniref:Transcriptional regulator n=1 Tax=Mycolicibacter kumamotonensis TaxID=354243 RepID=A0A1X0DX05_9MYCO|nr:MULTISPECIES: helix-turn-helix domain-containing protein [Mycobacteriaceae]ORA76759.1 transcriptional regulator [Mycolicibacter kumamotonensis]